MTRRDPEAAFRALKRRVRDNAFRYTDEAFARMVDRFLYEEDVKRAFSTGTLAGLFTDARDRTLFAVHGFGMNEEALGIVCRMSRTRVVVVDVFRLDDLEPELPEG
ncbi:MAG TPA: DUF4258 domain-containing protein [Planctomycetota bacterium]